MKRIRGRSNMADNYSFTLSLTNQPIGYYQVTCRVNYSID